MSFNKTKTDPILGKAIHDHLVSLGVETPTLISNKTLSRNEKIDAITIKFRDIMEILNLDLTDDSLQDTPKRVAKMYVNEILWGLEYDAFPKCTTIENKMQYDEMVVEKGISVMSLCEHHFVTIDGLATVAYIPKVKVLGLSKMNRVVEYFSRRPQVQERQTEQIFHSLSYILETPDVAVLIDAKHYCVKARGVEDTGCSTITSKLGGGFKSDPSLRAEFMALARIQSR